MNKSNGDVLRTGWFIYYIMGKNSLFFNSKQINKYQKRCVRIYGLSIRMQISRNN